MIVCYGSIKECWSLFRTIRIARLQRRISEGSILALRFSLPVFIV